MAARATVNRSSNRPMDIALEKYLLAVSGSIQDQQEAAGMVASGDSINSHVITVTKNAAALSASNIYQWLIHGRDPGPIRKGALDSWIKFRNIQPRQGQSEKQMKFLIKRKIERDGYEGKIDIISATEQPLPALTKAIGDEAAEDIADAIVARFTKLPNVKET